MMDAESVAKRLIHLIEYQHCHVQKQCYANVKNNSIRVDGIGMDRWHFIGNKVPRFLVSLYHVDRYLYYNFLIFPCPVMEHIKGIKMMKFCRFIKHKGINEKFEVVKVSQKEKKMIELQGHIDAAKRGEYKEFANKIGTKKKK